MNIRTIGLNLGKCTNNGGMIFVHNWTTGDTGKTPAIGNNERPEINAAFLRVALENAAVCASADRDNVYLEANSLTIIPHEIRVEPFPTPNAVSEHCPKGATVVIRGKVDDKGGAIVVKDLTTWRVGIARIDPDESPEISSAFVHKALTNAGLNGQPDRNRVRILDDSKHGFSIWIFGVSADVEGIVMPPMPPQPQEGPPGCGILCRVAFPIHYAELIKAFEVLKGAGMSEARAREIANDGAALAGELYRANFGILAGMAAEFVAAQCGQCAVDSAY